MPLSHPKTVVCQLPPQSQVPPPDSLQVLIYQKLKQDNEVSKSVRPQTGLCSPGFPSEPGPRKHCGPSGLPSLPPGQGHVFAAQAEKAHTDLRLVAILVLSSHTASCFWSHTTPLLVRNSHNSTEPPDLLLCDCLRLLSIMSHRLRFAPSTATAPNYPVWASFSLI